MANPSESLFADRQLQAEDDIFAQVPDTGDIVGEKVIGPDGGPFGVTVYEDDVQGFPPRGRALVFLYPDSLKQEANIQLFVTRQSSQDYLNIDGFGSIYPVDKIRYISPLATLKIPIESINFTYPFEGAMFDISPSYNPGELDAVARRDIRFEVRIYRKDGTFSFYTQRFGRFGLAAIDLDFLQANLGNDLPETLTISIQAVDISDALPNPDDFLPTDQNSGSENQE
ncbi:MAG: hypothetical protein AAF708_06335 [Deinococcota bacterium]